MAERPFELRGMADGNAQYGRALFQKSQRGDRDAGWRSEVPKMVVKVHGTPMKAVLDQVLTAIKQAGSKPSELSRRAGPFDFSEKLGVRLGLPFLSVEPLYKPSRMSDIVEQIQGMTEEEAYNWFSSVTDAVRSSRSQNALRILLAAK